MNVLVIGSGGREHALAWALSKSPLLSKLYCAPGNGGMADIATCLDIDPMDFGAILTACRRHDIGFVVVGPEQPLAAGLVDQLSAGGIKAFGPTADAARLEASKAFTKEICASHNIPTAASAAFTNADAAKAHLRSLPAPYVVKADGLAAGKGVVIAEDLNTAENAIDEMFAGAFGAAGREIVIEEFLTGEEASFFVLTDGAALLPLATAQDHKRVGAGDTGPNTGGMGAYSPAPVMTPALCEIVLKRIIRPTIDAMAQMNCPYKGVLYAGLMITAEGPKLIEYNARFGDSECQVLMMRLASDLLPALIATVDGTLENIRLDWRAEAALTVVMAAKGYPGAYKKGSVIGNLLLAAQDTGAQIFHAGTARQDAQSIATGGRVLNVTALGTTVGEAAHTAYKAVDLIDWPQGFCRRDIGWRAIEREGNS